MSSITINGVTYSGNNISIKNNRVFIDGVEAKSDANCKEINIQVSGNINELKVDSCNKISVTGSVASIETTSGDVVCGPVTGSITTVSGDVECEGNIGGNVGTTSGDVKAKSITGNTRTVSGDITSR
jgi:hypothetical protein